MVQMVHHEYPNFIQGKECSGYIWQIVDAGHLVDEDEGSPTCVGVNHGESREKIEKSAEALRVCHNPSSYPSKKERGIQKAG
jgi:hypothetical protein